MSVKSQIPSKKLLKLLDAVQKIDSDITLIMVMYKDGTSAIIADDHMVGPCADETAEASLEAPRGKIRIPS